jgi:hypothetical protein
VLIAGTGDLGIAWVAVLGFALTLVLQRFVPAPERGHQRWQPDSVPSLELARQRRTV